MPKHTWNQRPQSRSNIIDLRTGQHIDTRSLPVICERIRFYREKCRIEQIELSTRLGLSLNCVSNWENGRGKPSATILPAICKELDITLYQLFGLDGPNATLTEEEEQLIEGYRKLSSGHQMTIQSMTDALFHAEKVDDCRQIQKLPLHERQLAAGIGDPTEFEGESTPIFVYADNLTLQADAVFIVNGDSMEPDYPDGCMVLVQWPGFNGDMSPGDIGAFIIGNEMYIKEYQKDGLHSINPAYPVMHFDDDECVYLVGRVIGIMDEDSIANTEDVKLYASLHPEFDSSAV